MINDHQHPPSGLYFSKTDPLNGTTQLKIRNRNGEVETAHYPPTALDKLYDESFRIGHGVLPGMMLTFEKSEWPAGDDIATELEWYRSLPYAADELENFNQNILPQFTSLLGIDRIAHNLGDGVGGFRFLPDGSLFFDRDGTCVQTLDGNLFSPEYGVLIEAGGRVINDAEEWVQMARSAETRDAQNKTGKQHD